MIIKGKSRTGSRQLGSYLNSPGENEKVRTLEVRGTVAQDIPGSILEMEAYALGTKCEMGLYHAMINPEPPNQLTPQQCTIAVDTLEAKLGFEGHARVVVLHEKLGRQHLHVVWTRIDLEKMTAVHMSQSFRKHEEAARDLERQFGHERVQGAHAERDGVARPDRTASRAELRQEERTGIKGKTVKAEISRLYQMSDGAEAFKAALEDKGYVLAQGDRRDFIVIDSKGGIHSLARRIDGVKAKELREFMSPIDRSALPTAEQAKELAEQLDRRSKEETAIRDGTRLEKAYGRGEDYVSQSTAAQKDHDQRQQKRNHQFEKAKTETLDPEQRYEAFLKSIEPNKRTPDLEDDPSRQPETPGGGRTRGH